MGTVVKRLTAALGAAEGNVEGADAQDLESLGGEVKRKMGAVEYVTEKAYAAVLLAARDDVRAAREADEYGDSAVRLEQVAEELEHQRHNFVVQVPRYGAETRAKAAKALERLGVLLERVRAAQKSPETLAEEARVRECDRNDAMAAVAAAQRALQVSTLKVNRNQPSGIVDLGTEIATETAATLKAKDETLRQRNRLERKRSREKRRRDQVQASNASPRGPDALDAALTALGPHAAIGALAGILHAIHESPDDVRRRKLRCAHDAFRRDFGDFPIDPRLQAVIEAAGFRLLYRTKEPSTTKGQLQDTLDDDDDDDEEPVFIMQEPDPMSDLDAWSAWFDAVSACDARLQDAVSRL